MNFICSICKAKIAAESILFSGRSPICKVCLDRRDHKLPVKDAPALGLIVADEIKAGQEVTQERIAAERKREVEGDKDEGKKRRSVVPDEKRDKVDKLLREHKGTVGIVSKLVKDDGITYQFVRQRAIKLGLK